MVNNFDPTPLLPPKQLPSFMVRDDDRKANAISGQLRIEEAALKPQSRRLSTAFNKARSKESILRVSCIKLWPGSLKAVVYLEYWRSFSSALKQSKPVLTLLGRRLWTCSRKYEGERNDQSGAFFYKWLWENRISSRGFLEFSG
jgi:hypothetical protein